MCGGGIAILLLAVSLPFLIPASPCSFQRRNFPRESARNEGSDVRQMCCHRTGPLRGMRVCPWRSGRRYHLLRRVIDAVKAVNKPTSEAPDVVELGGSVAEVKEEEECGHCSDFGYF